VKKTALGDRNVAFTSDAVMLGRLTNDLGQPEAAEPILRDAASVNTEARGAAHQRTANARLELGRCLQLLRRFTEAEPLLVDSHRVLVEKRPAGHQDIVRAERYLAEFYAGWNAAEPDVVRAGKAAAWQAKAAAVR
jgi:hypothetical protein